MRQFNILKDASDTLALVTLVYTKKGLKWPVERRFNWRLAIALLDDPEALEEAFTSLCHNIGIARDSIVQLDILPLAVRLATKQEVTLLAEQQEGKGNG